MASLGIHICSLLCYATFLNIICCYSLPENHIAFFVFGDSLFDAGNNNYINTTVRYQANFWPYGETFFKYSTGRFSDGRIIPDFIAEFAGLPLIPPYLQPGNYKFVDGVNFASAGAGALIETHQGFVVDLNTQVSYFKNIVKLLRQELGDAEAKRLLGRALYIFSIGSNDYLAPISENSGTLQSYSKEEYVAMVLGNLTVSIEEIHKKGGRKFGFLSLGPLGCIPGMKLRVPPGSSSSCLDNATTLAHLHNRALTIALKKLEKRLGGFKFTYHDFYTSLSERMNNPLKYGFKLGNTACCGSGPYRGQSSCGVKRHMKFQLCEKANEYLFFDSGHPTERANRQIAELWWNVTPNMTWPYNLKALFNL